MYHLFYSEIKKQKSLLIFEYFIDSFDINFVLTINCYFELNDPLVFTKWILKIIIVDRYDLTNKNVGR